MRGIRAKQCTHVICFGNCRWIARLTIASNIHINHENTNCATDNYRNEVMAITHTHTFHICSIYAYLQYVEREMLTDGG